MYIMYLSEVGPSNFNSRFRNVSDVRNNCGNAGENADNAPEELQNQTSALPLSAGSVWRGG